MQTSSSQGLDVEGDVVDNKGGRMRMAQNWEHTKNQ